MVCALVLYLYSPVLLVAVFLVTIPPLVLPRRMNAKLKQARDDFSRQMAAYTQQLKELLGGFRADTCLYVRTLTIPGIGRRHIRRKTSVLTNRA